jgi:hypothetical protein
VPSSHWAVAVTASGCWEWQGSRNGKGYGQYMGRLAHVVVWEAETGQSAPDKQLDHLCRNRVCVRPEHLEPVSPSENLKRRDYAYRRTKRCKAHDQDKRGRRTPQGGWVCLECAPLDR